MSTLLQAYWPMVVMLLLGVVSIAGILYLAWPRKSERHPDEPEWNRNGEEDRGPWGNDNH